MNSVSIDSEKATSAALIGRARRMYEMLSEALASAIADLRDEEDQDPAGARARLDLIRSHHKALQTVIDIEVSLEKRSREIGGASEGVLDLDAARAEVWRRLARLQGTGGD
ncbi:hypothetical protein FDP22_15625 [Paroceanicella profunda]|uniref:Permease n=1 Tax=Paroceanicella profunda TaxID=2579971 RepID=A0A5B8FIC4_9RHOB|nr:hypothetical protein [Paroceanicella profunda]QDL93087.1 hypothetical protein FDP22_15625 [Paroceanicella profunda]